MDGVEPSCLAVQPNVFKLDKWTSHLESEVGIGPTLSRFCRPRPVPISRTRPLKVQAKVDSDHHIRFWRPSCYHWHHSPIEKVACIHMSGIGKSTAKFPSPKNIFTQCKAWNGTPTQIPTENTEFVALEFMRLAYGSIQEMAGDDGIAPPLKGSEPSVPLLYESPIEKERSWHHRARPSGFIVEITSKRHDELYYMVVNTKP